MTTKTATKTTAPADELKPGYYKISDKLAADLDNQFTYHAPFGTQAERYVIIRDKARDLAFTIAALTPVSADQNAALRKLREVVMTANAAIAINEKEIVA